MEFSSDFPLLVSSRGKDRTFIYLDSAATTQKPLRVLDAERDFYLCANANPHRGTYSLSRLATELYESSRDYIAEFINAESREEIVFVRNATEAANLVAYSYGLTSLQQGDEIALLISEHHSNLLPWQMVARATGAKLNYLYVNQRGRVVESEIQAKIGARTRIVAASYISNVLGTVFPLRRIADRAHEVGAVTCFDCAQALAHRRCDIKALGADFAFFSGHKAFAPMGIGFLYGRKELLRDMPPFLWGGEMVDTAGARKAMPAKLPLKFEAGTQNAAGAYALAEALRYIDSIGYDVVIEHEQALIRYLLEGLSTIPKIRIYGNHQYADDRCGIAAFNYTSADPKTVSDFLDRNGIVIRAGAHCAHPLMTYLGTTAACRVSLSIYNTSKDIDVFLDRLENFAKHFHGYT
ncbi:MAG: aminotransferase class V-fold PLP-dependent enzyme [Coriobacteriia bacterium]